MRKTILFLMLLFAAVSFTSCVEQDEENGTLNTVQIDPNETGDPTPPPPDPDPCPPTGC